MDALGGSGEDRSREDAPKKAESAPKSGSKTPGKSTDHVHDGGDHDGGDHDGGEEGRQGEAEKYKARGELENAFVTGMVKQFLPMVEACDKQAYAVSASQEALLKRIREVDQMLQAFAETDHPLAASLEARANKLRDTRARLASLNDRLRVVQRRLLSMTMQIDSSQT